jgi:hypothetical protein
MTDGRRVVALVVLSFALGVSIFGIVRGLATTGPGHGVRLIATIAPPVTDDARAIVEHVMHDRLEEPGMGTRTMAVGDQLVVELGNDDPVMTPEIAALLERTGKLEVHAVGASSPWLAQVAAYAAADREAGEIRVVAGAPVADQRKVLAAYLAGLAARAPALAAPQDRVIAYERIDPAWRPYLLERASLVDPRTILRAEIAADGVAVYTAGATQLKVGVPVAFVLDDAVTFVGRPDRVDATAFHVPTSGPSEDAAIRAAMDLVTVIEIGAAHPLHVTRKEPFSRATGFVPRAWPFLAIGLALAIAGVLVWRRGHGAARSTNDSSPTR